MTCTLVAPFLRPVARKRRANDASGVSGPCTPSTSSTRGNGGWLEKGEDGPFKVRALVRECGEEASRQLVALLRKGRGAFAPEGIHGGRVLASSCVDMSRGVSFQDKFKTEVLTPTCICFPCSFQYWTNFCARMDERQFCRLSKRGHLTFSAQQKKNRYKAYGTQAIGWRRHHRRGARPGQHNVHLARVTAAPVPMQERQ